MAHAFLAITMTPAVKALQAIDGSHEIYRRAETGEPAYNRLTSRETAFIAARDSLYMASVGETGWPYIQHRGGPRGFVKVLDEATLGFLDFRGNRQFLTAGNLQHDDRVSLFLMDYPGRKRLKILGHAQSTPVSERPQLAERLALPGYRGEAQRIMTITIAAFDWNCPQHITPRFTKDEMPLATDLQSDRFDAFAEAIAMRGAALVPHI